MRRIYTNDSEGQWLYNSWPAFFYIVRNWKIWNGEKFVKIDIFNMLLGYDALDELPRKNDGLIN